MDERLQEVVEHLQEQPTQECNRVVVYNYVPGKGLTRFGADFILEEFGIDSLTELDFNEGE